MYLSINARGHVLSRVDLNGFYLSSVVYVCVCVFRVFPVPSLSIMCMCVVFLFLVLYSTGGEEFLQ